MPGRDGALQAIALVLAFSGHVGATDGGGRWSQLGPENLTAGPFTVTMTTRGGAFEVEERWRSYERD